MPAWVVIVGPLLTTNINFTQLPFVWAEWQPLAQDEYTRKLNVWRKQENARLNRLRTGLAVKKTDEISTPPPILRMHEGEAENLLDLANALKIILARSVLRDDLPRAEYFLDKYLQKYLEVRSSCSLSAHSLT